MSVPTALTANDGAASDGSGRLTLHITLTGPCAAMSLEDISLRAAQVLAEKQFAQTASLQGPALSMRGDSQREAAAAAPRPAAAVSSAAAFHCPGLLLTGPAASGPSSISERERERERERPHEAALTAVAAIKARTMRAKMRVVLQRDWSSVAHQGFRLEPAEEKGLPSA